MSTSFSTFREPVRVLIGDNDPDIKFREDAQLDAAMRAVVNLGKVIGEQEDPYAVIEAGTGLTPDLTPASDALAWAQLVWNTAKLFAVDVTPMHWRTRAFSETIGENKERVWNIFLELYNLENGGMVGGSSYPS